MDRPAVTLRSLLIHLSVAGLVVLGALLGIGMLLVTLTPSFRTEITVVNESGQDIRFTPIGLTECYGDYWPLPRYAMSFSLVPAVRQSDFQLAAGRARTIKYNWDDIIFTTVLVEGDDGRLREVLVDPNARVEDCCYTPRNPRVIVGPLDKLPEARSSVMTAADAGAINFRALIFYVPFFWPLAFVGAWLVRRGSRRGLPEVTVPFT